MTEQHQSGPSVFKLSLYLYPFTMTAVALNFFMLTLAWQRIGLPVLSPVVSIIVSLPLAIPVNWIAAKWVRRLLDEAGD